MGTFSVKSIYEKAISSQSTTDETFELIWKNVAPPRVQCFGWLSYIGRVKTSEYLLSLGVIHSESEAMCTFCNRELESLDHLLLHCAPVWRCWADILRWVGVSWATPASIVSLFHWWNVGIWQPRYRVLWAPIPLAVVWSIWNARNLKVFENKPVDWNEVADIIMARVAFWVSSSKKGRGLKMDDIIFRWSSVVSPGWISQL